MSSDECGWCCGTGLVTLYRKGYEGNPCMTVEDVNYRTGEIIVRRVPGTISIHCRECGIGEHRYQQFKEEDRRKLWTTRHMMSDRRNYVQDNYLTTDPTFRPAFDSDDEAIAWFARLGNPADALPDPKQGLRVRKPA
jgi:hypothetical protein